MSTAINLDWIPVHWEARVGRFLLVIEFAPEESAWRWDIYLAARPSCEHKPLPLIGQTSASLADARTRARQELRASIMGIDVAQVAITHGQKHARVGPAAERAGRNGGAALMLSAVEASWAPVVWEARAGKCVAVAHQVGNTREYQWHVYLSAEVACGHAPEPADGGSTASLEDAMSKATSSLARLAARLTRPEERETVG